MKPKVSVVVPIYNVECYLDRCVQSIRNQTLRDIEIILVNDGSPDNCPAMCDNYAQLDSRIKVVHKQNAGLGMACNSGIEMATGDYIAFCDSDDWIDKEMYEKMYSVAHHHNAEAVFTGLKRVNSQGEIIEFLPHPNEFKLYEQNTLIELANDIIASKPSNRYDHILQVSAKVVLYRRSIISENGIRFVSERQLPSEDLIFNLSFLKYAQRAVIIPEYFYNYFCNNNSITSTFRPNRFDRMMNTVKYIKSINLRLNSESEIRLSRFVIGEARIFSKQIFESSIRKTEKWELLNLLSQNIFFIRAIDNYPVSQMPWIHYIVMYLLKNRYFGLLKLIYKLS